MYPTDPSYESLNPREPEPEPRHFLNRLALFKLQTGISIVLLAITLAVYALNTTHDGFLKVIASPFGGLSVAVFVMFLTAATISHLQQNRVWSWKQILLSVGLLIGTAVGAQLLMMSVLTIGGTLSRLLFLYSLLFSGVALIYLRVRNLWTMAAITGVCEGVVAYLVFFAK